MYEAFKTANVKKLYPNYSFPSIVDRRYFVSIKKSEIKSAYIFVFNLQ